MDELNGFATICLRVSFERAFGNEVLLKKEEEFSLEEMCLFKKKFLKFFTGNRLQVSGNQLHSYILKGHDF